MKIPVVLNGNKVILESRADAPLMEVLRKQNCLSVKFGCAKGFCGSCTVLLDGIPVASCKIPAAIARNSEITTLEYFSKTEEYRIIAGGFKKAGITLCGYCNAGKIFTAYQLITMHKKLSRAEITDFVKHLAPCCTELDTLVNGIVYAINDAAISGK